MTWNKNGLVYLCMFNGECAFKYRKNNGKGHGWKKALVLCTFDGNCNQKKVMNHNNASRKYGITK